MGSRVWGYPVGGAGVGVKGLVMRGSPLSFGCCVEFRVTGLGSGGCGLGYGGQGWGFALWDFGAGGLGLEI